MHVNDSRNLDTMHAHEVGILCAHDAQPRDKIVMRNRLGALGKGRNDMKCIVDNEKFEIATVLQYSGTAL